MTKSQYRLMQDFLPNYYKYILMNPNTYISPILGVYNMTLTREGVSLPMYFMIKRNVRNFDL